MPPAAALAPSQGGQWAPSACYLRADENLRVTSYNALASVGLSVRARIATADGQVEDSLDAQTPATNRTATASILRTNEGWLLGGQVVVTGAAPLVGQTFVVVEIVRGESTAANAMQLLAAGYVTAKQPLAFPQAQAQSSLDGGGALRSISGTTPAAGAEISETVPTGARWELLAFFAQLVTSVTVTNRLSTLLLDDGANVFARIQSRNNQTASSTSRPVWMGGVNGQAELDASTIAMGLPVGNRLGAGFRIRTLTVNIQVGDQYSAVQYLVREWIEGA